MFYNDDSFKWTKTIVRFCLDILVDVDLEVQFYSSCIESGQVYFEDWNENSKLQRWLSQERPVSGMFFVWTLYLMLTATSDIRCSSMLSTVFCILKSHSRISYGSLFARASNFALDSNTSTSTWKKTQTQSHSCQTSQSLTWKLDLWRGVMRA